MARKKKDTAGAMTAPLSRPVSAQDIIDMARHEGPACIATMAEIMRTSNQDGVRLAAANSLLDRGYGKPGQPVEISGPEGGAVEVAATVSPAIAALIQSIKHTQDDLK